MNEIIFSASSPIETAPELAHRVRSFDIGKPTLKQPLPATPPAEFCSRSNITSKSA
jgi:hypothetical protein